jgi:hypothetical protein
MYLARFSYDVLPLNRDAAMRLIRREVDNATKAGRSARLLTPLTRGRGGAALQFEIEIGSLDDLERFRHSGVGDSDEETRRWMQELDALLLAPPTVEILRIAHSQWSVVGAQ